jgi:8-oxo-dGTP pyrophosphatase MutT (NUDIX family)
MTDLATVRAVMAAYRPNEVHAPAARPAAVALLLVAGDVEPELLFIERAVRAGDPWSGQIAFPGGRRDPVDVDLTATAIRETREETSVELHHAERLGTLDDLHPLSPLLPPVVVRPFVFALPARPVVIPSPEVREGFWVPLSALRTPGVYRDVTVTPSGGTSFTVPAYLLGSRTIWGMTERILTPLLEMLHSQAG